MTPIRVLLAEDHDMVRQGLKLLIDAQPDMAVVADVSDGRGALERAKTLSPSPQVAVLDVSMPEMNGLLATREMRAALPDLAVVALTRYSDDAYVQAMLAAGASGYVLKQSEPAELLEAIRAVATGKKYLDTAVSQRVTGAFVARFARAEAATPKISERETDVLRLIAAGHSNKEVAASLDISVKTVEVHKANAMRKLQLRGRIDLVRYAVLQGWLREP